jgi:hypothetical protein
MGSKKKKKGKRGILNIQQKISSQQRKTPEYSL